MNSSQNKVWYASYGSNLRMERFLCYIRGGQPEGNSNVYEGCRDQTLPEKSKGFYIERPLYFAKESKGWNNGGVGFISNSFDDITQTLSRMHLITKEQFIDLVKQETMSGGNIKINFDECKRKGSLIVEDPPWYGRLIYLGEDDNHPIFTFTAKEDLTNQINRPDESYLKTIIEGIKETFPLNAIGICDYLLPLEGVKGHYTKGELLEVING